MDDALHAAHHLARQRGAAKRVDFLVDSAGFEFVSDLSVAGFLLRSEAAGVVYLHLKMHPMFVPDAMIKDVRETVAFLAADDHPGVRALATRLRAYRDEGRLKLREHLFLTSPLPFWKMPPALRRELGRSALVISKGDANSRRLLGDRHCLRCPWLRSCATFPRRSWPSLKSEMAAGLPPGRPEALAREDPIGSSTAGEA